MTLAVHAVTGWKRLEEQAVTRRSLSAPGISHHSYFLTWTTGWRLQWIGGNCSEVKEGMWPPRNIKLWYSILYALQSQRANCKVTHLFQYYRSPVVSLLLSLRSWSPISAKRELRSKFKNCVDRSTDVVVTKKKRSVSLFYLLLLLSASPFRWQQAGTWVSSEVLAFLHLSLMRRGSCCRQKILPFLLGSWSRQSLRSRLNGTNSSLMQICNLLVSNHLAKSTRWCLGRLWLFSD